MKIVQKLREILEKSNPKERTVIVDTSALHSKECMKIIDEADKVILLTGIISEMDKLKHVKNLQGVNIREVSRRSREDKEGKKYVCVSQYQKCKYQDDNIIDYCKRHRHTIILTSDNNLCNKAKAYGISYIFFEAKKKKKSKQKEEKKITEPRDTPSGNVQNENTENHPKEKKIKGECPEFYFYPRWIRAKKIKGYKIFFRVERDGVQIKTQDYKLGDTIYMCKYDIKHNRLELYVYKIVLKDEQYGIEKMYEYDIKFINEFYRVKCSEELRDQMTEFYVKNARY